MLSVIPMTSSPISYNAFSVEGDRKYAADKGFYGDGHGTDQAWASPKIIPLRKDEMNPLPFYGKSGVLAGNRGKRSVI
jgi:hypothetical protein